MVARSLRRWSARILCLLCALILLGGCIGSPKRATTPILGSKPVNGQCLGFAEVAAYDQTMRYLPSGFPGPAPTYPPSACYSSAALAERAGFQVAPIPGGFRLVGGIYLGPTSVEIRATCQKAASLLGGPVGCPTLLPTFSLEVTQPTCSPLTLSPQLSGDNACVVVEGFVVSWSGFFVPDTYKGVGGGPEGHLVITSAPQGRTVEALTCQGEIPQGSVMVQGHQAANYACPESSGIQGGHVGLRWSMNGATIAVSVHGDSATNRALALSLAQAVVVVG